jgi:hypothetical protein
MDSTADASLTEEKCERKWYLKELVPDSYYYPIGSIKPMLLA